MHFIVQEELKHIEKCKLVLFNRIRKRFLFAYTNDNIRDIKCLLNIIVHSKINFLK